MKLAVRKQAIVSLPYKSWMVCMHQCTSLALYSLSGRTSYRKISRSLEAAWFGIKLFQSLCNSKGTSAALLLRCLLNLRANRLLQHPISRLWDFTRFGGETSYCLVNRGLDFNAFHLKTLRYISDTHQFYSFYECPLFWFVIFLCTAV